MLGVVCFLGNPRTGGSHASHQARIDSRARRCDGVAARGARELTLIRFGLVPVPGLLRIYRTGSREPAKNRRFPRSSGGD